MEQERPRPLSSVNVVAFGISEDELRVLLARYRPAPGQPPASQWALPGGLVEVDRDVDLVSCARRIVKAQTGVAGAYLEQLGGWGSAKRDPRGWSATQVYIALISAECPIVPKAGNGDNAEWHVVERNGVGSSLAIDHDEILTAAVKRLRGKSEYTSLPAFLLPDEFTLGELQRAYEVVLGRQLEKSAFRTRVLTAELVTPLDRYREAANRPARLYRLSHRHPVYFPRSLQSKA